MKAAEEKFAGKIPELLGMAFMQMQAQGVSFVPVVMQSDNLANISSTVQNATKEDEQVKKGILAQEELEDNEFLDFDFCG